MIQALLLLAGAAQAGQGVLQAASGFANAAQTRTINRERLRILQGNADLAVQRGGFEAGRVRDRLDEVTGQQAGYFAAGNLDPTFGSPAFLAAESAAQAELDAMAATARGFQGRAEAYGQMAGVITQTQDAQNAARIGAGSAFLNTLGGWASLGLRGGLGGAGAPTTVSAGPMRLQGSGFSGGSGAGWGGMW